MEEVHSPHDQAGNFSMAAQWAIMAIDFKWEGT